MAGIKEAICFNMSVGCSLEELVQHQENKNTLSKTKRDVSLLKRFLVSRSEPRELENIDARDLDVLGTVHFLWDGGWWDLRWGGGGTQKEKKTFEGVLPKKN